MADEYSLVLGAEPVVVNPGEESQITATVTDQRGNVVTGKDIQFTVSQGGKLSKPKVATDAEGKAQTKVTALPTSAGTTINVTASLGTANDEVDVVVNADDTLGKKQKELEDLQREADKLARDSDAKQKAIDELKQDIEGLRKVSGAPQEITAAVDQYRKFVEENGANAPKAKRDTLKKSLPTTEAAINLKLDKAKQGEIAGKRSRFDKEVTASKAAIEQLDKDINDLVEVRIREANKLLIKKMADYRKGLDTQKKVATGLERLEELMNAIKKEGPDAGQKQAAYAYLAFLDAKDKLAEVETNLVETSALEKSLSDAWKQVSGQQESLRTLAGQLQQKRAEREALVTKLKDEMGVEIPEPAKESENEKRKQQLRSFIDGMQLS